MTENAAAATPEAVSVNESEGQAPDLSSSDLPELTDAQLDRILANRKWTEKVDGEIVEINGIEDLRKGFLHGKAANKRMQQAAEMRKQSQQIESAIESAKAGDLKAFTKIFGEDVARQLSEQLLLGHIQYEQMDPAERRAYEAEQRLAEYEAREKAEKEQSEKSEYENAKAQALQEIDLEFAEALKKMGRKPTHRMILRMTEDQIAHLTREDANGPLPAERVLSKVIGELETDIKDYLADVDVNGLLRVLPENSVKALRKHFAEAARSQDPLRSGRSQPEANESRQVQAVRRKKASDWWAEKEKTFGSRIK